MRQTLYVSIFSHFLCALLLSISFFIEMDIMILLAFNNILPTHTSSSWHRRYSLHELLDNQPHSTLCTTRSYPASAVIFSSCVADTGNIASIYKIFGIFLFWLKSCSEFSPSQLWGPLTHCVLSKISYKFWGFSKVSWGTSIEEKKRKLIVSIIFRHLYKPYIQGLKSKKP